VEEVHAPYQVYNGGKSLIPFVIILAWSN